MINFIKDAVTAVSGIKTFLFNTDYRNNFDLQNVEFPCCILTPIMNKKYDLNNIIRESAELQLSVVESAPYDYDGDELYAINKRCSDLALQIIANLQVKSKLDKELTFEFILPSGDEFISGVMCNLQVTMKQGSCIGAPSYVEVVVQPVKRESITTNGKHTITPSSGFNAMREVEVDVNIVELTTEEKIVDITSNGEVEILPTNAEAMTKVTANVQVPPPALEEKQVTITKAKTTEIITPDAEYGLSRVEVSTDIPLESKQVTITENGTTTIEASEGFEGIESVEVTTDVNTLQGLDFSNIFDQESADDINQHYKDGIERARAFQLSWDKNATRLSTSGQKTNIYIPNIDLSNVETLRFDSNYFLQFVRVKNCKPKNCDYLFYRCLSIVDFEGIDFSNCESLVRAFELSNLYTDVKLNTTSKLKDISRLCFDNLGIKSIELNTDGVTNMTTAFVNVSSMEKIKLTSVKNVGTTIQSAFASTWLLTELYFDEWKMGNVIVNTNPLIPYSIHYIIQNAMDVADGATARTLTLHATAKTNWQNSEYYAEDLAVLSTKGITIA